MLSNPHTRQDQREPWRIPLLKRQWASWDSFIINTNSETAKGGVARGASSRVLIPHTREGGTETQRARLRRELWGGGWGAGPKMLLNLHWPLLSIWSISSSKHFVKISNYDYGLVCFSFLFCQLLLYMLWGSVPLVSSYLPINGSLYHYKHCFLSLLQFYFP